MTSPLVAFDGAVQGAVLSYNVPEPIAYNGQMVFKLYERRTPAPDVADADRAVTSWLVPPSSGTAVPIDALTLDGITRAMRDGFTDSTLFPYLGVLPGTIRYVDPSADPLYYKIVSPYTGSAYGLVAPYTGIVAPAIHNQPFAYHVYDEFPRYILQTAPGMDTHFEGFLAPDPSDTTFSERLRALSPAEVLGALQSGAQLRIFVNGANRYDYTWVQPDDRVQIALIEQYRLSSYLGNYGAGRTIQTFSLLPGEKTRLTFKTYKKTVTDAKAASSILDSFTEESANELEDTVADETANKSDTKDSKEWHVEAELSVNYGFVNADAKAGYSGGTTAAREQQARNVVNATRKHAVKASSQRDINITQTTDDKTDTGEESSVSRDIQNINVGATLNFVFRQLNQEYYSILHLVDVQLGYFDSAVGVSRFTVAELEQLLDRAFGNAPPPPAPAPTSPTEWNDTWHGYFGADSTPPTYGDTGVAAVEWDAAWTTLAPTHWAIARVTLRQRILAELLSIVDHEDATHPFIVQRTFSGTDFEGVPFTSSYWRTRSDMTSTYTNRGSGFAVAVPGIILATTTNVMRTDGIIVDALLGRSPGLDTYSAGLQTQAVALQAAQNDLLHAQNRRLALARAVLDGKDAAQAEIFGTLFAPPPLATLLTSTISTSPMPGGASPNAPNGPVAPPAAVGAADGH